MGLNEAVWGEGVRSSEDFPDHFLVAGMGHDGGAFSGKAANSSHMVGVVVGVIWGLSMLPIFL